MDSEMWISRLVAAKRHLAMHRASATAHTSHSDRLGLDDYDAEEELRLDFPCPYCYEDHDVTSLCAHLEDEHPFESKPVACPVCSVTVPREMLDHITLHHGHLFKLQRRHRLRRVAIPSNHALTMLGKDLQETYLKVLLGTNSHRANGTTTSSSVTDALLSSLVLNLPSGEVDDTKKAVASSAENTLFKRAPLAKTWKLSADSMLSREEKERRRRRAIVRASFVQDLLLSSLFGDE